MHCAEDIVGRMEALRHANKLWASAFSEAALDKSWWFGGTKTTSSMVYALLGLRFHKLLVNPGVMADWVQHSGVILIQATQFFPELDVSCCCSIVSIIVALNKTLLMQNGWELQKVVLQDVQSPSARHAMSSLLSVMCIPACCCM